MLLTNKPHRLLTPNRANEMVKELQQSDPDWQYKANHDVRGEKLSYIEVYDENGYLIGKW